MFKQYQREIFDPAYVIGNEPNFEAAGKYVYVLTQIFSGSKPETSNYTDYKGKYRCKFGRDSDLEAFSHNPPDGSLAPLAYQPST